MLPLEVTPVLLRAKRSLDTRVGTEADERMHMIIRRTTVLIGADARVSTEDITGLLEGHDFTVLGMAADGRQIVDAARRLKPDVVVADASMSGLSAIELLHAFAAE